MSETSLRNAFRSLHTDQKFTAKPQHFKSVDSDLIYREDKRKQGKKIRIGFYFATLVVIIGALSMIFPYIWMLLTSFKSSSANICIKLSSLNTMSGRAFSISLGSKIIFLIQILKS